MLVVYFLFFALYQQKSLTQQIYWFNLIVRNEKLY